MTFTRVSETEASFVSSRGTSYRILACADGSGAWMIVPDVVPAQPTFFAVPQKNVHGYEIRNGRAGEVILGYAMNLSDAAWPVEEELIRQAGARDVGGIPEATADPPQPDRAAREAQIRRLCQDHGWRFHAVTPGSEARYVIEGYLPGASREDRVYAAAYVREHQDLFTRWPQLQPAQITERNRANSDRLSAEARAAFDRGEHELALAMMDDAEWWAPLPDADRIRDFIRNQMNAAPTNAAAASGRRDALAAGASPVTAAGPAPELPSVPLTGGSLELRQTPAEPAMTGEPDRVVVQFAAESGALQHPAAPGECVPDLAAQLDL